MQQQQEFLMVASVYEAMKAAAIAIAAAHNPRDRKKWALIVGHMLFPEKDPEAAGRYFADCLNPDRNEKLDPEQYLWLKREAKRVGCHILHSFDCTETEYAVSTPVEPEDEAADLNVRINSTVTQMKDLVERYERATSRLVKPQPLVR